MPLTDTHSSVQRRSFHRASGLSTCQNSNEQILALVSDLLPLNIASVRKIEIETAISKMAENTRIAFANDLKCYFNWCMSECVTPVPTTSFEIVRYVRHLEVRRMSPATITRWIVHVNKLHQLASFGSSEGLPTQSKIVSEAIGELRRKHLRSKGISGTGTSSQPKTDSVWSVGDLLLACDVSPKGIRDSAIISLIYYAGLKTSELVAIDVTHLKLNCDGTGILFIPKPKSNRRINGISIELSIETVQKISPWLNVSQIEAGPLFRRINILPMSQKLSENRTQRHSSDVASQKVVDGISFSNEIAPAVRFVMDEKPLTRVGVLCILRNVTRAAVDHGIIERSPAASDISANKLRARRIHDLIDAGESIYEVARILRWKSLGTALIYMQGNLKI